MVAVANVSVASEEVDPLLMTRRPSSLSSMSDLRKFTLQVLKFAALLVYVLLGTQRLSWGCLTEIGDSFAPDCLSLGTFIMGSTFTASRIAFRFISCITDGVLIFGFLFFLIFFVTRVKWIPRPSNTTDTKTCPFHTLKLVRLDSVVLDTL